MVKHGHRSFENGKKRLLALRSGACLDERRGSPAIVGSSYMKLGPTMQSGTAACRSRILGLGGHLVQGAHVIWDRWVK